MKLLQEPDSSLYIVIRAEGEECRLTAKPSGATIMHCGARLRQLAFSFHTALQLVLLQDSARKSCCTANVPCCIAISSLAVKV
jgi:hypothetical protein